MSRAVLTSALVALSGTLGMAQARAADMPAIFGQPAYAEPEPEPQFEFGTGWYLRGDLTASDDTKLELSRGEGPGGQAFTMTRDWTFGAGGGAGYQFNDYFRADVTGDYLTPIHDALRGAPGHVDYGADLNRWDALANGYIDFGNWSGLTPYVGAGVGLGGVWTTGSAAIYRDHAQYDFAWAAMAGLAYHVSPHILVDVGYRYLDLGSYTVPVIGARQDLTSHQVRVGVRYAID